MKRIYMLAAALIGVAFSLGAQDTNDALIFSGINYGGTARTIGMGNAVTAVGSDLGTIGINPAGSAVAPYSQITFTPGFSLSLGKAAFAERADYNYGPYRYSSKAALKLPNMGVTAVMNTGSRTGLKSVTVGFVSNSVENYTESVHGAGINSTSSMLASLAAQSDDYGYDYDVLGSFGSYNSWKHALAFQTLGFSDTDFGYVGSTEYMDEAGNIVLAGDLGQDYKFVRRGSKNDLVFNMGFNFSDRFFLGFNLGMPMMSYGMDTYFTEESMDPSLFGFPYDDNGQVRDIYFLRSNYSYAYSAEATGIYAKMGILWRPLGGLRLGAAIQTPSWMEVTESYQMRMRNEFEGLRQSAFERKSPEGEYVYSFTSPYIVNLGAAYTFGSFALVSVDYEMQDNRVMRFSDLEADRWGVDSFFETNEANRLFTKPQHSLRVGLELRPAANLSLRGGFGYKGSPECYYLNNYDEFVNASAYVADYRYYQKGELQLCDKYSYGDKTLSYSLGMGLSGGPLFLDFALRYTSFPSFTYSPYGDYLLDEEGFVLPSAGILDSRHLLDAVVTLGLRF